MITWWDWYTNSLLKCYSKQIQIKIFKFLLIHSKNSLIFLNFYVILECKLFGVKNLWITMSYTQHDDMWRREKNKKKLTGNKKNCVRFSCQQNISTGANEFLYLMICFHSKKKRGNFGKTQKTLWKIINFNLI